MNGKKCKNQMGRMKFSLNFNHPQLVELTKGTLKMNPPSSAALHLMIIMNNNSLTTKNKVKFTHKCS